ncbi:MAG: hypothetical protein AAF517_05815 [Planctomycetota bacterium]
MLAEHVSLSTGDFKINDGSIFGQAVGEGDNAGFSQIISLGGNASSDDFKLTGGSKVYGRAYASAHTMTLGSGSTWLGSAVVREAEFDSAATFAVDEGSNGNYLVDPQNYQIVAKWLK